MFVYDRNKHKLLKYTSAQIKEIEVKDSINTFEILFSSPDGESIHRKCRNFYEATQYMDEVAVAADAGATLIIVDN